MRVAASTRSDTSIGEAGSICFTFHPAEPYSYRQVMHLALAPRDVVFANQDETLLSTAEREDEFEDRLKFTWTDSAIDGILQL